jgi:hypothetical protein
VFAFVHIKAFSYRPYRPRDSDAKPTPRLRSFAHAMDFRETFCEIYAGMVYMWHRMRGVETDPLARRIAVLEQALDKSRVEVGRGRPVEAKEPVVEIDTAVEVAVDGERQWLGVGDDYGYGLSRRERSESLGEQFEKELAQRGYGRPSKCNAPHIPLIPNPQWLLDPGFGTNPSHNHALGHKRQSWWRSACERVSQTRPHHEVPRLSSPRPKRKTRSRPTSRNPEQHVRVYDDQPPTSILKTYCDSRIASQGVSSGGKAPQFPSNAMPQDLPGLPMQDRYPHLPVNAAISRADPVFDRLFSKPPPQSDGGHTSRSGGTSVAPPSSQSHRTHLPLNAAPEVLPQNVDSGRSVEVVVRHPESPNTNDAQELRAELTVSPVSPPQMQRPQEGPNQSGAAELPPPVPPRDPRRSSHLRELAHVQPSPAQVNFAAAPTMQVIRAPNTVSDPQRIALASNEGERSHHASPLMDMGDQRGHKTPPVVSLRSPKSRTRDPALARSGVRSPRSRALMGVAAPPHTFSPELPRSPRSKGTPRMVRGMAPAVTRPSFSLNYSVYNLPDARSSPSIPRADQTLSRHQDS